MTLIRTKDRRTITIGNLSFAAGEVDIIHPDDVPYELRARLGYEPSAYQEIFDFSCEEGVLSPEDYLFLIEMTALEAYEFWKRVTDALGVATQDIDLPSESGLDPEGEAMVKKFAEILNGWPTAEEPEQKAPAEEEKDEGDDGLSLV